MPGIPARPVRVQKGKLEVTYYKNFSRTSICWSCGGWTALSSPGVLGSEFYCADCEVIWRE